MSDDSRNGGRHDPERRPRDWTDDWESGRMIPRWAPHEPDESRDQFVAHDEQKRPKDVTFPPSKLRDSGQTFWRAAQLEAIAKNFTTTTLNKSTFVICERNDAYKEHPLIYVKLVPDARMIVITDTGADTAANASGKPDPKLRTRLRQYLEHCNIPANNDQPLNPVGKGQSAYTIITSHCHYDHTLGIPQFLSPSTHIISSAAGRHFIESDFYHHGLFDLVGRSAPSYTVTDYVESFEHRKDLNVTFIQTPGHTPDSLAWYDHSESHLYVGDSFYRIGDDGMPILFTSEGNLVEWVFSMQKLAVFVKGENKRLAKQHEEGFVLEEDWVDVSEEPPRVKVSCGHQTFGEDAEEVLKELEAFSFRCFIGKVPVVRSGVIKEVMDLYAEEDTPVRLGVPRRLMTEARRFFGHDQDLHGQPNEGGSKKWAGLRWWE